jgi:hypothetical protein
MELVRVCLFAGLVLWIFGGLHKTLDIYRYFDAHSWPTAEATVVKSEITSMKSATSMTGNCSRPIVEFSYLHEGTVLRSDRWGFPFWDCSSSNWAYDVRSRHRVGSKMIAYVNSESGIAVLDPSLLYPWLMTLVGLGCAATIWMIRPNRNR